MIPSAKTIRFRNAITRQLKLSSFFGKSSEIILLQIIVKTISMLAFASAARMLGPTKLAESTLIMGTLGVFCAFSALYNDAFLARRIGNYSSPRARRRFLGRVFAAQAVTTLGICVLFTVIFIISSANHSVWVGLVGGNLLILSTICHPRWLFVSQAQMTKFWRISALGSCVTAALLFSITESFAVPAIDIACIGIGTFLATLIGWRVAVSKEGLRRLSLTRHNIMKHLLLLLNKSKWLSCAYVLASASASADSLLIALLADPITAGTFRPMAYLAGSTQQALSFIPLLLFPLFIRRHKEGNGLPALQFSINAGLIFSFLLILSILYFCIDPIFSWLYGPSLGQGAQPFLWLLVAKLIGVLNYIFLWGLIAQHRDKTVVLLYAISLIATVAFNLILIPRIGLFGPGVAAVIAESLVFVFSGLLLFNQLKRTSQRSLT
jgi:O-antigen/teichoic acid export membrane protein